jgi:hypothetical protein
MLEWAVALFFGLAQSADRLFSSSRLLLLPRYPAFFTFVRRSRDRPAAHTTISGCGQQAITWTSSLGRIWSLPHFALSQHSTPSSPVFITTTAPITAAMARDSVPIPSSPAAAELAAPAGRQRRRNSNVVRSSLDLVFSCE